MIATMRWAMALAMALALTGLAGCSSMKIHSDWSPDFDFKQLGSWTWADNPHKTQGDPLIQTDSLLEDRVKRAVEQQLAAKGYGRVESGSEDFQVSYFLVVEDKVDVTTVNDHYGYGYGGPGYHSGWGYGPGGWGSQTVVDQYQEGSLILDVTHGSPSELVWRGSATARLSKKTTPEKSEKTINEAVSKILERFPPEAGSKSH